MINLNEDSYIFKIDPTFTVLQLKNVVNNWGEALPRNSASSRTPPDRRGINTLRNFTALRRSACKHLEAALSHRPHLVHCVYFIWYIHDNGAVFKASASLFGTDAMMVGLLLMLVWWICVNHLLGVISYYIYNLSFSYCCYNTYKVSKLVKIL